MNVLSIINKIKSNKFIVSAVFAAIVLRLFRIGSQNLWVDEILSLGKIIPKPGLTIWDYLFYNIQGPFHALVVHVFHYVSVGEAWLRLPSALAGTASIYYFYRWLKLWLGASTSRLATAILVVHPLHIHYSQEVRAYTFLFLFSVISCYYLHRLLAHESWREWFLYVITIALAALSNFTAAFLYASHTIIYLVRRAFTGRRLLRWVVASILIGMLISPWIYRILVVIDVPALFSPVTPGDIVHSERLRGETTVPPSAVPYLLYSFSVGFTLGPSLRDLHFANSLMPVFRQHWLPILWVGLLFGSIGFAGARKLWKDKRKFSQTLIYLIVPVVLVLVLCWQNAKAFNVRYLLVSLPAFICVVAVGLRSFRKTTSRVLTILVFLTLLFSLSNYYFDRRFAKEDVRGAARHLEAVAGDEECILAPTVTYVFAHYFNRRNGVYRFHSPAGTSLSATADQLVDVLEKCDTLWYLRTREWDHDPNGFLLDVLTGEYVEQSRNDEFNGITLIRYQRRSAP